MTSIENHIIRERFRHSLASRTLRGEPELRLCDIYTEAVAGWVDKNRKSTISLTWVLTYYVLEGAGFESRLAAQTLLTKARGLHEARRRGVK